LSQAIYGTTYGARLLLLSDLIKNPPKNKAPEISAVSTVQLNTWLYGEK